MTKPKELKVGDRVSDGMQRGYVVRIDNYCRGLDGKLCQYAKVAFQDGQYVWENRYGLRKLPNKEGK